MNGFCQFVHVPQILHWFIVLSSSLLDRQQGVFQTDCQVLSILASRRHLIGILISSMASELMEHCLTEMGISPDICCTMLGGKCLANQEDCPLPKLQVLPGSVTFSIPLLGNGLNTGERDIFSLTGKVIVKALEGLKMCPQNNVATRNYSRGLSQ